MPDVAVSEIAAHAAALRAELKEWERGFAAANGGRKAGRNDIKQAPEIAAKYKEYSRLKAQESYAEKAQRRQSQPSELQDRHKKRKHSSPHGPDEPNTHSQTTSTPRKSTSGIFQTPSKTRTTHPSTVDPYDSPSVLRRLFSPSTHMQSSSPLKTAIGPTPQRDGKALGLFDLLSESGGSTATPSATKIASLKGMAAQTPSKKRKVMDTIVEEGEEGAEEEQEDSHRVSRTPASSGKKYMLSALFATPTTLRYSAMVEDDPSTSRNLLGNLAGASQNPSTQQPPQAPKSDTANLETPSFLRRSTSGLYSSSQGVGGMSGLSPIPVRKPPQFVGKGLSQLVQGLRDMEEERLEDEWDLLREIEIDQEHTGTSVDVPDSQAPDVMGRTYKKKGQKRTTRLVRMKPVIPAKPRPSRNSLSQSQPQHLPLSTLSGNNKGNEGAESEFEDELEAIAEIQANGNTTTNGLLGHGDGEEEEEEDLDSPHSISEAEPDADSDSDPEYGAETKPFARTKSFSEKMKEVIDAGKPPAGSGVQQGKAKQSEAKKEKKKERDGDAGKENKKPPTRKVNPQAHANYRSLKIRNRGGRGGRNFGRFRRR